MPLYLLFYRSYHEEFHVFVDANLPDKEEKKGRQDEDDNNTAGCS